MFHIFPNKNVSFSYEDTPVVIFVRFSSKDAKEDLIKTHDHF